MTPIKCIRKYCLWCCNEQYKEVQLCTDDKCSLFYYRFSKKDKRAELSSIKSIRKRCLDCKAESFTDVKECDDKNCSLYTYRFGKNPNIKISEERRKELSERLALIRKNRA